MPEKTFSNHFSEAWEKYKKNFGKAVGLTFLLLLIADILNTIFILSSPAYSQFLLNPQQLDYNYNYANPIFLANLADIIVLIIVSSLVSGLFYLWAIVSLITLYSDKKTAKLEIFQIIGKSSSHILRAIGLSLVTIILLIGLFLLLIIPGIIFAVFWTFGMYALINDKTRIIESLRKSFNVVKGRWWKTLGYAILIWLIIYATFIILDIPYLIFLLFSEGTIVAPLTITSLILTGLYGLIIQSLVLPFTISFFQTVYTNWRDSSAEKRKK